MLEQIMQELGAAGHKLTGKRRAIVEILLAEERHWTAKEILVKLRARFPAVSFDTVYRNLSLLKQMGLVHEMVLGDGGSRYKLCYSQDHHHHLVCLGCGQTLEIPVCPMQQISGMGLSCKFKITGHRFEVYGYCEGCSSP
ncbi:MAG: Fur family transcriptional regulator [Clostridia bacterium]|nr:Fur family transcriptional regulator [Clostridia bacterium]